MLPLLTRWHVGLNECMFLTFSPHIFSWFLFVLITLCGLYFYLFYPVRVLSFKGKENEHCLEAEALCVWGEGGAWRKILTSEKSKYRTCVKSCIIYEICKKE